MRKSALLKVFLILLAVFFLIQSLFAQGFGKTPLKECWQLEKRNVVGFEIASDNAGGILISDSDGFISLIDALSGKIIWRTEIGGEILPGTIADAEKVYLISKSLPPETNPGSPSTGFTVRALSLATGIASWQKSFSKSLEETSFFFAGREKLFLSTESGLLLVLAKDDGEKVLERKSESRVTALPFLKDGSIYFGTNAGTIEVISAETGQLVRRINLLVVPKTFLIDDASGFVVGDAAGNIYSIDGQDSTVRWKTWAGAEISSISRVEKGLLVSSLDNYVYLLSEKNGKRLWKKRLSGRSIGKPFVKDDVAVFSTFGGTDAVFIDLDKGRTVNQVFVAGENFFTNNPKGFDRLVFFRTFQGISAYSSAVDCGGKN